MARLLFAAWQVHAVQSGASAIVLGFTAFELLFGILQLLPVEDSGEPGIKSCPGSDRGHG